MMADRYDEIKNLQADIQEITELINVKKEIEQEMKTNNLKSIYLDPAHTSEEEDNNSPHKLT